MGRVMFYLLTCLFECDIFMLVLGYPPWLFRLYALAVFFYTVNLCHLQGGGNMDVYIGIGFVILCISHLVFIARHSSVIQLKLQKKSLM